MVFGIEISKEIFLCETNRNETKAMGAEKQIQIIMRKEINKNKQIEKKKTSNRNRKQMRRRSRLRRMNAVDDG